MTDTLFDAPTPVMPVFDPARCYVRHVSYGTIVTVLAEAHYIGTPGATSVSLGMYVDHTIAGVITFGTIPRNNASAICGPGDADSVMELTRLALYDWAPKNSESWFIAQAFDWLRRGRPDVNILISYADGAVGHVGTIYQATNFIYTGTSTNDYVYHCDSGEVLHPRTTGRRSELPPGRWRPSAEKHRYVTFLGSRATRKRLRSQLRWDALDYPKPLVGLDESVVA